MSQDLRMFFFTCPTCGQTKCQVVFSTPFDPKAKGAILGFTHHDNATNKNDPMGFAKCGLRADVDKVRAIDDCYRRGVAVPKSVMKDVVKGKPQ